MPLINVKTDFYLNEILFNLSINTKVFFMAFPKTLNNKNIHCECWLLHSILSALRSVPHRVSQRPRCLGIKTRPCCFIRVLSVCKTIYCFLLRRITAPIFSRRAEYVTLHSLVLWPNKLARSALQNHTAPVYLHNSHSITGPTRELFCPPHRARSAILVSYTARAPATFITVILYVHFPERQFSTLYVQVLTP